MFYQPSASRDKLLPWVKAILNWSTFSSPDRAYLDEITASEVLDMAYLEGTDLTTAITAHALYPPEVEQAEARRGMGANSSMSVTFPVEIIDGSWGYEIMFRAVQPSMLAIGQGGRFPRPNPDVTPPSAMITPRIGGTEYQLQELTGKRLRTLAGPIELVEYSIKENIKDMVGSKREYITLPSARHVYAYVDDTDTLHVHHGSDGLQPLSILPKHIKSFFLQDQRDECKLELEVSWERREANQVHVTVQLRMLQKLLNGQATPRKDSPLAALVLPHVFITLRGARAHFPTQQYAETKRAFLAMTDEERQAEAERRLYQVRQSGCIATRHPDDDTRVVMSTFGVFDTPLETPVPGPLVTEVTSSPEDLLNFCPSPSLATRQFVHNHWTTIQSILLSAAEAFNITRFHLFQWEAIAAGLELKATGRNRVTTIIRAPTGAGKTVVFMVNAAISSICGSSRSTSLLLFPTRLLNEDMFRRLTSFVFHMRQHMPHQEITGGIRVGTGDQLYKLLYEPKEGEILYHYGTCPACGKAHLVAQAQGLNNRLSPTCTACGHIITYMYDPYEVTQYLPSIVIATPDKIFHDATVKDFEAWNFGLFGAPVRRCQTCGRAFPDAWFKLKPTVTKCVEIFKKASCSGSFSQTADAQPIAYMGFDEVHSLSGSTVTYLSAFLATLEMMERVLARQNTLNIRFETATATIANERELLEAITRRRDNEHEILTIPPTLEIEDRFTISRDRIRYRVLLTMPARVNSRNAVIRSILNAHLHLRGPQADLKERLVKATSDATAWDFLLGYVFKIQDGLDLRRALIDFYRNQYNQGLKVEFLSGMSPKNQISRFIDLARTGSIDILLANLVVSLGIDIHDLNHMIMYGVPRSFTEYVQIAGRTGRGKISGHVGIVLLPHMPRDTYLYRHFHAVFSDVAGYYDALPVRSTNLYCSEEIFGNVAKGVLTALCFNEPTWTNPDGVSLVTDHKKRDGQIQMGIAKLLCDDPVLLNDTQNIVVQRYRNLKNEFYAQTKFLGPFLETRNWLLRSLRGRSDKTVRVVCLDQDLIDLIDSRSDMPSTDQEE